mmetsp:Transcript_10906/g.11043  ORF Transcript_10906/g.11043 Transcript_10906/m.11043 type:complete len:123 (+) Transcript_10906:706-1074(+)
MVGIMQENSNGISRNPSGQVNMYKGSTSNKYNSNMLNVVNPGISSYNLLSPDTSTGQNSTTGQGRKKYMDDLIKNVKKQQKVINSFKKTERIEKNVIIRKNSSKSLLKDSRNLQTPKNLNQT